MQELWALWGQLLALWGRSPGLLQLPYFIESIFKKKKRKQGVYFLKLLKKKKLNFSICFGERFAELLAAVCHTMGRMQGSCHCHLHPCNQLEQPGQVPVAAMSLCYCLESSSAAG